MPNIYQSIRELEQAIGERPGVAVIDRIHDLIYTATFSPDAATVAYARQIIRQAAQAQGCGPASIQNLYEAMGRGEVRGLTVPAINIRVMTFDVARAIFRVAKRLNAGPILFEIARSEVTYTAQRPAEYATAVFAAALAEGWTYPVFIQGDHFQINAKKYAQNPQAEVDAVKKLIAEAIEAGFYNIDIDTSTLVDLKHATLAEQQRLNYEVGVELNQEVRRLEPAGITISIGGEIGEVGGKNSTPEELQAYMDGYQAKLPKNMKGISKISVQTGTSHGGVVLPDGSIKQVQVDFETLHKLSQISRDNYGIAGAVQHGASTLPDELFDKFLAAEACEIHLATGFQNIIYQHTPKALLAKVDAWIHANCADERKAGQTDEQFIYQMRKKGFAPFKQEFWQLPNEVKNPMLRDLEAKFDILFRKLGLPGSAKLMAQYFGQ